jgi:cyanophycin synthetase
MRPEVRRMRELRDAFYLAAWQRAAAAAGAELVPLSGSVVEIVRWGRRLRVCGNLTSLDDPVTLQLAGDKPAVYRLLAEEGIPVPQHAVLDAAARCDPAALLRTLPAPLVVKPAADTGAGAGVSTNVATPGRMRHALAWAWAFGSRALVEQQIAGDCYRVLILDQEVIDVVRRRRPRVTGDGRSSVRQLIAEENRRRLRMGTERAQVLIRHDLDLSSTLALQKLRLGSRPPKGATIDLKQVINDNCAEENEAANGVLCGAILNAARKAAGLLRLRLAGVDVVCRDPSVPLEESGGTILDINSSPGFYYHYRRTGPSFAVADHILQHFFARNLEYGD